MNLRALCRNSKKRPREKTRPKKKVSSSSSSSSSTKWEKLGTHDFEMMFPLDKLPKKVLTYKDVFGMFECYYFPTGTWLTGEFLEFMPEIFKVNVQAYHVAGNKNGYLFKQQWGEVYSETVFIAFIQWSTATSERSTRRGSREVLTIPDNTADPNHYDTLLVDQASTFKVISSRGTKRGGSGYIGSVFNICGFLVNTMEENEGLQIKVFNICVHYIHTYINIVCVRHCVFLFYLILTLAYQITVIRHLTQRRLKEPTQRLM